MPIVVNGNGIITGITTATISDKLTVSSLEGVGAGTSVRVLSGSKLVGLTTASVFAPGSIIQVVNIQTGTLATGTTTIPIDNTIPQNTEGTEFMTLAITPTSATSKLIIDVIWCGAISVTGTTMAVALFQDSTANALAVSSVSPPASAYIVSVPLRHYMTAGSTAMTTFKIRAGMGAAGTTTFNGAGGIGYFGGTLASSITITEIAA